MSTQNIETGIGIRLKGVRKAFDHDLVGLDGVDLDVGPGEFVALLGPSGCGKSTLLKLVAGLHKPTEGTVEVRCDAPLDRRALIAYVFQDAHLLPWRTVVTNVALPLELMGLSKEKRVRAAREALAQVGLADFAERFPNQLSGGMKMRVSLARALVTRPKLLLMDEPFAALDEVTRFKLDEQLRALWLAERMTVLFVTHSVSEAVFLADRSVVLSRRPGRISFDRPDKTPAKRDAELRSSHEFAARSREILRAFAQTEVS